MVVPPATGPGQSANSSVKPSHTTRMNGTAPSVAPPTFPYSARRAPRLDLSTVERKGQPAARDPPSRNRPYGLQEAPTYRPTEAEFRDPMEYIRSISEKASTYGICKIIPPDNWNPDFAIDSEKFHFRTRKQEINLVEGNNRTNLNYLDQLAKFHKQYGAHLNRFPSVDKRPLDLYKLKKAVEVRGGFDRVCKDKKWAEIGRDLGYSGKIMSSLSTSLKNSYQRWLHPYEEFLKYAKPGVHQQMEFDYPGFSQSPAAPLSQHQSPANLPRPSPSAPLHGSGSPAVQASMALHATLESPNAASQSPAPARSPPHTSSQVHRPASSGFTAVNSGGFAAVNSPATFSSSQRPNATPVKQEIANPVATNGFATANGTSANGHAGLAKMPNGSPLPNGVKSHSLKRTISHDSLNGESGSEGIVGDGDHANARRSKRPRKDGSASTRALTPQPKVKPSARRYGDKCETCGKTDDKPNILLCDSCDLGYHRHCMDPPPAAVSEYEWHCSRCLVGNNEYGFEEGNIYSLKTFQEKANQFKESYFARMPFDPIKNHARKVTEDDIEKEFWRLVEDISESVEVEYGADIHSTTHGSGFPTIEKQPLDVYSKDPWNLNVLPFHEDSLFRHIKGDISGMTVPWLYVGMCFSTFCWHNEDHYAYSANYQHFGSTKTWYGIPGSDALAFEAAMREAVPELFESQPDLLFQLVTILPPSQLRKAGVNVYALDQRAGQFVITFPQAYHAGFNHGFNCNEAVNFAPSDWEPFGDAGVQRLQDFHKNPCFSHDELLFTAAASDTSIKTAKWLAPALERTEAREVTQRNSFVRMHKSFHPHTDCHFDTLSGEPSTECGLPLKVDDLDLEEEEYQCAHCKAFAYLSQFRCEKSGKVSCLLHPTAIDCCDSTPEQRLCGSDHVVVLRYNNHDLHSVVQKVVDKANVPKAWEAKLDALLDGEACPSLKSLHSILSEGEKIQAHVSGLADLGQFVKKCDQWVEEANVYLTRKQQNRRKTEKAWRRSSARNNSKSDDKEPEVTLTLERMKELIEESEHLGFSAPQTENLQEKLRSIDEWRENVKAIFERRIIRNAEELEGLYEDGKAFMILMPELNNLDKLHQQAEWTEQVRKVRRDISSRSLDSCRELSKRSSELGFAMPNPDMDWLSEHVRKGDLWEIKAKEIMAAEDVHYPQLEALHSQVQNHDFPVNQNILTQMDAILAKNREAKRQIITLVERSHDADFRKRPMYAHVRDVMKGLEDLNGKPHGAADLERELRRHEDWMRKGKKLFGKANAPLHILEQHMKFVEERNSFCFDLNDTFRPPVEPASREASPVEGQEKPAGIGDEEKPVFCICRQPEAGLMIECEICHDWYHAKCLKLARGKVKECEMFTCPICDWRVKIPRDAARPRLEDLQMWGDEMPHLPFQPEEEEVLKRIVDKSQAFRDFLSQYTHGNQLCRTVEEMPEMLFYLRKLEGAEVLLAHETNIFRQELHKWQPIAPEPPPISEQSLSTRKPRPTKQQKLMKELGVEKPEDLPPHLRTKSYMRRKPNESYPTGTLMPKPSQDSPTLTSSQNSPVQGPLPRHSSTPVGVPRQASTGNAPVGYATDLAARIGSSGAFEGGFGAGGNSTYPASTPSPMFSPTGSHPPEGMRDPLLSAALAGGPNDGRRHDPSFPLFRNHADDDDLRAGLAGTTEDADDHVDDQDSPPEGEYDDMFREMTNHDDDEVVTDATPLEPETSQATEALELINREDEGGVGRPRGTVVGGGAGLGLDFTED